MRIVLATLTAAIAVTSAHAAGGGAAFPPFDSSTFAGQLFWLAVTFGLLYFLMSRIALPRIGEVIETRRATIEGNLRAAEQAQKEAEAAAAQHEKALAEAKANAQGIANEAKARSAREADQKRQGVEKDLSDRMIAAEKSIAATKSAAMANVADIAREAASAMVEQLSGRKPESAVIAKALGAAERE